ncbi:MAG: sulfatase-like hydrolase/transferase, partial [Akkermansia sp.]
WGDSAAAPPRHATMVARVDAAVGDLLQLCRDLGIERNTLVVFTSDNGPHDEPGAVPPSPGHPAPAQNPAFFRSFGPLDGIKRDVLEGGLRVPCLVWGPGLIRRGAVSAEPSQFQDWMATFADLAGLPKPMRCDGVSLLPLLRGDRERLSGNIVYSEYFFAGHTPRYPGFAPGRDKHPRGEQQVLYFRDAEGRSLKAIRCGIRTGREDFEIYDTLADTHETQNLAPRYAALMPELRRAVLYARRPYDYVRDPAAGARRTPCRAARCYDALPVPAEEVADVVPGWEMRRVEGVPPWVPEFDTLPQAAAAEKRCVPAPGDAELPPGSVTEFRGYLRIPRDGLWRFALRTSAAAGSRAYMRMHRFALIDADATYIPGTRASSSACPNAEEAAPESGQGGIPLCAGLHAVCLTVVQGSGSSGHLQLEWQCGDEAAAPIPADAFLRAQPKAK